MALGHTGPFYQVSVCGNAGRVLVLARVTQLIHSLRGRSVKEARAGLREDTFYVKF
jgi:hypothetical protein